MSSKGITMVDTRIQYELLKSDIDHAINDVLQSGNYVRGSHVEEFAQSLAGYLQTHYVIPCGNGTDALQIALMSLQLECGDEVIMPAFTFAAAIEVVILMGLKPVLVDVLEETFNIDVSQIESRITSKTRAIIPVHLFGLGAEMEMILKIAEKHSLFVIEDNAQALGGDYLFKSGEQKKLGTIGHLGITSFFPTKNLSCFGDGGAIFTNDIELAKKCSMIANHGQEKKYEHKMIGCNSRLDSIQAAVLHVKLRHLDDFNAKRRKLASIYSEELMDIREIKLPDTNLALHIYHQYTIKISDGKRDGLRRHLQDHKISSMVYYPFALHQQPAFKDKLNELVYPVSERLTQEVLSLPMYPELNWEDQKYIIDTIKSFFKD